MTTYATNYKDAWATAERRVFDYINKVLGTVEGIHAFGIEDVPATLPSTLYDVVIWSVSLGGGIVAVPRQTRQQVQTGAWQMEGMFRAQVYKDAMALLVGGVVFDALPANGDDIEGIARLWAVSYPERHRTTARIVGTNDAGQEDRVIELTIPLVCAFYNQGPIK